MQPEQNKETYIMKRIEIICPDCMKKKVIQETADKCFCDNSGQIYQLAGNNTLRYTD
jgi:hypothetical protein